MQYKLKRVLDYLWYCVQWVTALLINDVWAKKKKPQQKNLKQQTANMFYHMPYRSMKLATNKLRYNSGPAQPWEERTSSMVKNSFSTLQGMWTWIFTKSHKKKVLEVQNSS